MAFQVIGNAGGYWISGENMRYINKFMFNKFVLLLILFCSLGGLVLVDSPQSMPKKGSKSICVTFDQLPVEQTFVETDREQITADILSALKKHKVKAAGFVIGNNVLGQYDLLGNWLNEGHVLGNMTNSQQDLEAIGVDNFIKDISSGAEALNTMLEGFGQKKKYFRYPYLHYGNTIEEKRDVGEYLAHHNNSVAHVTIVVEDFLYNLSLEKLGDNPDSADLDQLGSQYLEHVMEQVTKAEAQATMVLHRSCRHILQLRANALNAMVLDELLAMLEENNYKFISLDKALADKLYDAPEAYFGSKGIGYIEMIRQSDTDFLPAD